MGPTVPSSRPSIKPIPHAYRGHFVKSLSEAGALPSFVNITDYITRFRKESSAIKKVQKQKDWVMDLFNSYLANYGEIDSNVEKDPLIVTAPITDLDAHHFRGFLGWFIVRKVMMDGDKSQYVPVLREFLEWIRREGAIQDAAYQTLSEALAEFKGVPERCEKLSRVLSDFSARDMPTYQDYQKDPTVYRRKAAAMQLIHNEKPTKKLEGYFSVAKVGDAALWVTPEDANSDVEDDPDAERGTKIGPIQVPEKALKLAKVGDQISGLLGKMKGFWKWFEVWNVYPR